MPISGLIAALLAGFGIVGIGRALYGSLSTMQGTFCFSTSLAHSFGRLQSVPVTDLSALADPRVFPDASCAPREDARLYALAAESLTAESRQRSDALDREIREDLRLRLGSDGAALAALFAGAPSVDVTRHLWRQLDLVWQDRTGSQVRGLGLTVFAFPIVIVSGVEGAASDVTHSGVLGDPQALATTLREHGALGGSQTFALANALVSADAIDLRMLPELFRWQQLPESTSADFSPRLLMRSPFSFPAGREGVHLRFLVGSALARPDVDLLADADSGAWGVPFTKELSRQLAVAGTTVLALASVPQPPLVAVRAGRAAQREVGAQIFASNAIRKIRATVGEPTAIISAHHAQDAPGGGELRLSLSSPFAPRDAEGFRCPLYPLDRVGDVASMLVELMADCRVIDVRVVAGAHADRDPATGLTLLFKPDTLPSRAAIH